MKTVSAVALLMLLVASVAARGSLAQAGPSTSAAFAQCQAVEVGASERCRPLAGRLVVMVEDGVDFSGIGGADANEAGQSATPEHSLFQHVGDVLTVLVAAVWKEVYDHFVGGGRLPLVLDAPAHSALFDPAR